MRDDRDHSPNARTSLIGFDPLAALSDSLLFFDDCRVRQYSCVRYIQAPLMIVPAILRRFMKDTVIMKAKKRRLTKRSSMMLPIRKQ